MRTEIVVRPALPSDSTEIGLLFNEFFDFHKTLDDHFSRCADSDQIFSRYIDQSLTDEKYRILVAVDGSSIAGYCIGIIRDRPPVYEEKKFGELDSLAISAKYRNHGVGSLLFSEVKKWFFAQGIDRIEIMVSLANESAFRFWRKMGFAPYMALARLEKDKDQTS